ncbi:uncharacterized protein LOC121933469 [Sceloporus undulatus]|uniref:uncharacterized protein LOC121933469 n=1 Tax=Sceloporus undulatus TaxID=8520 RepID=UPI001C4AECE9|nr:uncharacterized protein LOC121933469 [Sceloporus undulatus]
MKRGLSGHGAAWAFGLRGPRESLRGLCPSFPAWPSRSSCRAERGWTRWPPGPFPAAKGKETEAGQGLHLPAGLGWRHVGTTRQRRVACQDSGRGKAGLNEALAFAFAFSGRSGSGMEPQEAGSVSSGRAPDTRQVEVPRRISRMVVGPEEVTFEDVAVNFSTEEWTTLQGWQKELHKEVMLENYTLLLSVGCSVPSVEFSSLISQLEGATEDQKLGWADRENQCRGGRPSFPDDLEGPWDLEGMNHKEDRCLTPTNDGDGEHQSSFHLCALMKLVKEIPEFLYGHGKAPQDPIVVSDDDGSESEAHGDVKARERKERFYHLGLQGNMADILQGPLSPPYSLASSTEEEWIESQIQEVATNTDLAGEGNPAHHLLKCETEAPLNLPCQFGVQNGSPQSEMKAEACTESTADTLLRGLPVHEEDGEQEDRAGGHDSLENGASRDTEPSRTEAGVGEEHPPKEPIADPGHQLLPSLQKKAELDCPSLLTPFSSVIGSGNSSSKDLKGPETMNMRPDKEDASEQVSLNMAPEMKAEEKPLHGLLKCLKELIVHQPQQPPRKPPLGGCQETLGHRRRDVGSGGSPPIQVKTEAMEEGPLAHSPRRKGAGPPLTPRGNLFQTEGSGRINAPQVKGDFPLARVKVKREKNSPPLQSSNSANISGPTGQERRAEETSALGMKVKLEAGDEGEDIPFSALKGPPEEEEEEEQYLQPCLLNSGSSHSGAEPRMDLGIWAPYPEEWSPATSPLHGLLKCLKEIPVPGPPSSKLFPGKRATPASEGRGGEEEGGKERRKGGRKGRLDLRSEWATPEKITHCPTSPVVTGCGLGNPLQGLEQCLKEVPPNASPSQPSSPGISSSIGSSPDRLPRWMAERGKWTRKEDGLGQNSGSLQGLERCLKEPPLRSHSQSSSPAVSSFSSSSDGLHRWTPEAGRWSRKEEGISCNSTPLQGLEHCLKDLPQTMTATQPSSPAVSSCFSSSLDGHRWTPEQVRWTRKEEGLSHNSTPLQGLENFLEELPGTTNNQIFLPAVSSTVASSSDRYHKPEGGEWSAKEGGPRPSGIPPLQGLENCLKEIPINRNPTRNSVVAAHNVCVQKLKGTEMTSQKPWKRGGGASSNLPLCPTSCISDSVDQEANAESSPLHRLMNCLKEIPIQRPSYLNTPNVFAFTSNWSEIDKVQQSLRTRTWSDHGQETYQGTGADEVVRQKEMESRRMERSPPIVLSSEDERLEERRLPAPRLPSASPLYGQESCLKGLAVSQMLSSHVPPARPVDTWQHGVYRGPEAGNAGLCPPALGGNNSDPEHCPRNTSTPATSTWNCSTTPTQDSFGEIEAVCSNLGVQHPPAEAEKKGAATSTRGSSKPLSSSATPDNSKQGEWDIQTNTDSREKEAATEGSPLQGLIQCLKEITTRGPSPGFSNCSLARNAQGESGHEQVEEEEEEEESNLRTASKEGLRRVVKEKPPNRAIADPLLLSSSQREPSKRMPSPEVGNSCGGATPISPPACGLGSCSKGNEHLCAMSRSLLAFKPCVPKWSHSNSPASGEKRALVTARDDDSPALVAISCSFESRGEAESGNPSKKRCPSLDPSSPLCSWENGKPPAGKEEIGDLGAVLSKKLDRLSADMSSICRDVSQLQNHMDRLEQDSRGWVLELAALRMENRSLCEYVRRMEGRCRTLENRSRRNNLRILGLLEGVEGNDAVSFLQRTLPAILGFPPEGLPLEIESARRVPGGASWDPSGRPRPLVFHLLRFADKTAILQAARARPLSYASVQVTILPDFCSSLSQRRRVPFGTFRRTRWVTDLCFGPKHPSCCYPWTRHVMRQPTLGNSGPLAGEREGRVSKGPGTGNWDTDPLAGPECLGGCHSASTCEPHNP